jgi:hypothetical protein
LPDDLSKRISVPQSALFDQCNVRPVHVTPR